MEKPKVNNTMLDDLDNDLSGFMYDFDPEPEPDDEPKGEIRFMPNGSFRPSNEFLEEKAVDLFGEPLPEVRKYPLTPEKCFSATIMGEDILKIRALTGKARKNADEALRSAAVEFLAAASKDCFWVPTNTASSKNSKEIGFYLKKSMKTGKMERVHILTDSAITKKYRKATAGYWLQNKVDFLNQTRHLQWPLQIKFTFVRDSLRAFDFLNAAQILADLMKEYGYFPDDDTVHFVPVFSPVVYYNSQIPGVLIEILK